MVAEQDAPLGGHEVLAILELVGWGDDLLVIVVDPAPDEVGVEAVAEGESEEDERGDNSCHGWLKIRTRHPGH